uniref:Spreg-1 protein n=1 Tax=Hofstenia miamia TaxID=442651 RepID=A0A5P8I4P6_HOFMI|nr:spreg-1 protein [Hofstenia miamia]
MTQSLIFAITVLISTHFVAAVDITEGRPYLIFRKAGGYLLGADRLTWYANTDSWWDWSCFCHREYAYLELKGLGFHQVIDEVMFHFEKVGTGNKYRLRLGSNWRDVLNKKYVYYHPDKSWAEFSDRDHAAIFEVKSDGAGMFTLTYTTNNGRKRCLYLSGNRSISWTSDLGTCMHWEFLKL